MATALLIQDFSFNPRAHAGRDIDEAHEWFDRNVFQSTRPRRARHEDDPPLVIAIPCFNPRAHAGRDPGSALISLEGLFVSIHAPTQGATGIYAANPSWFIVSIHAPTQGATEIP